MRARKPNCSVCKSWARAAPENGAKLAGIGAAISLYMGQEVATATKNCHFEPKEQDMTNTNDMIKNEIASQDVVVFMKGTPQFPQCGFSGQVVQILDYLGVPFKGINVLENAEIRQGIKDFSNWPTIPQVYVKGEFVGGCDIVREMFQSGELASHLAEAGVIGKQAAKA